MKPWQCKGWLMATWKWVVISLPWGCEKSEQSIIFLGILCHFSSYEEVNGSASHVCARWTCYQEGHIYVSGTSHGSQNHLIWELEIFPYRGTRNHMYTLTESCTLDQLMEAIRDKKWLQWMVRWWPVRWHSEEFTTPTWCHLWVVIPTICVCLILIFSKNNWMLFI